MERVEEIAFSFSSTLSSPQRVEKKKNPPHYYAKESYIYIFIYLFFVITLQHPDAEGSTGFNGPFTRQHTFIPINQVKSRFISAASSLVSEFGSKHIIQHCIKESYTLTATNLVTSFILNRKLKTTKKRRQRRKESEIHTQCPGPRSSGIISTEKTQSTGSCRSHWRRLLHSAPSLSTFPFLISHVII